MQVSFAKSSANYCVQGIQDHVEDSLSSDLEISFASAMSLSPLHAPAKLIDNVSREDVVPMDISPEPSRFIHQSRMAGGHFVEKLTRNHPFTTSRLFGRDLSNEAAIPHTAPLSKSGATIANYVCGLE